MGIEVSVGADGIAEVVQNCPPVNALTVAEWSRRTGIEQKVIGRRLSLGWDDARALSTPVRRAS